MTEVSAVALAAKSHDFETVQANFALPCAVVPVEAPMAMPCQALDLALVRGLGRIVTRLAQGA